MTTTGPYYYYANNGRTYVNREWNRQKPPFPASGRPPSRWISIRVQETARVGVFSAHREVGNSLAGYNVLSLMWTGTDRSPAAYRGYSKFVSSVNEEAMLLVNAAERKQAMQMLANSANRMLLAFQLLQRGRRAAAMKALGLTPKGKKWNRAADASKLWLEYHFGWEPMVKDIYSAVSILQSNPSPRVARGSSSVTTNTGSYAAPSKNHWSGSVSNRISVKYQATVRVSNPNLHRANQLGLINPASVAWELIPFSFLVDWFIPVGAFLNSYTDFVGLELENSFTTVFIRSISSESLGHDELGPSVYNAWGVGVYRQPGVSIPLPTFNVPQGLSLTRGATAIALLVGAFRNQLLSDRTRMKL